MNWTGFILYLKTVGKCLFWKNVSNLTELFIRQYYSEKELFHQRFHTPPNETLYMKTEIDGFQSEWRKFNPLLN